jgi:hypothetical protein
MLSRYDGSVLVKHGLKIRKLTLAVIHLGLNQKRTCEGLGLGVCCFFELATINGVDPLRRCILGDTVPPQLANEHS